MRIGITLTSSLQVGEEYITLTKNVANILAEENFGVVFGGTDYGMMGELAASFKSAGGDGLVGVMARDLEAVTKGYQEFTDLDEAIWCETMAERKAVIIEKSDGFLILPGGYGTIEELGDIFGGKVNKLYDKPIALLNFNSYYDMLISFFDELHAKAFSKAKFSDLVFISDDLEEIIAYFKNYTDSTVADKFID